jgi:hypothetical protein
MDLPKYSMVYACTVRTLVNATPSAPWKNFLLAASFVRILLGESQNGVPLLLCSARAASLSRHPRCSPLSLADDFLHIQHFSGF